MRSRAARRSLRQNQTRPKGTQRRCYRLRVLMAERRARAEVNMPARRDSLSGCPVERSSIFVLAPCHRTVDATTQPNLPSCVSTQHAQRNTLSRARNVQCLTGFALNGTAPSRSCCEITRCVLRTPEGTGSERAVSSCFRRAVECKWGISRQLTGRHFGGGFTESNEVGVNAAFQPCC
jgi:hypothetical protein